MKIFFKQMNDFSLMPSAVYIYLAATVIFDPVLLVGPVMLLLTDMNFMRQKLCCTAVYVNKYTLQIKRRHQ
jgi:hypothetical protein